MNICSSSLDVIMWAFLRHGVYKANTEQGRVQGRVKLL